METYNNILSNDTVSNSILVADKLANGNSWFNKNDDKEKAVKLYIQIFNKLIISKEYSRAAYIALKISELSDVLDDMITANDYYTKAATCFYKTDNVKSIEIYIILISRLENSGKFSSAAKYLEELGDIYEKKMEYLDAIKVYQKSCDFFEIENRFYSSLKILNKMANIHLHLNEIDKAKNVYFAIVNIHTKYDISKIALSKNLYMLALCEFYLYAKNNNANTIDFILSEKTNMFPSFSRSLEYKLLDKCIIAYKNNNENDFLQAITDYDYILKINANQINILNNIKQTMLSVDSSESIDLC